MRLITWNLFHGRALPAVHRDLSPEFAGALARWRWDVALLQEVPPWWGPLLGAACDAHARTALTSRNQLLPLRRAIARRDPEVLKSGGGGADVVLVRGAAPEDHRVKALRLRPERRVVHAVRLPEVGWVANVHAQVRPHTAARADLRRAGEALDRWAGPDAPVLLGGDCNVADPRVHGLADLGGHDIDRLLGRGWRATARPTTLERHGLSDHAPVAFEVERA